MNNKTKAIGSVILMICICILNIIVVIASLLRPITNYAFILNVVAVLAAGFVAYLRYSHYKDICEIERSVLR